MQEILKTKLDELYSKKGEVKILDIGGWFAPCRQATHMIDIMPFETMNIPGAYGFGDISVVKENYTQLDLCNIEKLPYDDKEFDFVVCRHTLEDLKDPILLCKEMQRVSKAGYIETPSRLCESTKGMERPYWCGYYHHRWLIEVEDNKIIFQFKPHNMHSMSSYHFRRYPWQKMKEKYMNISLMWNGSFEYEESIIIDYKDVINNLKEFKNKHKGKDLFRYRFIK